VKFLLATTDPQRLPVTVLSRCLQFNLKRLPVSVITARLTQILAAESVAAEPAALRLLATAADGSLRDALSLLDQLLAFGGGAQVREADARVMLGTVDRRQVLQLAQLLAKQDLPQLLAFAHSLEQWSPDYLQMLDELNSVLSRVALLQAVGKPYDDEDDLPPEVMAELAQAITAEDLQLYYQIGLLGRRDLPQATDQRAGFAMTLLRMLAFRPGAAPAAKPSLSRPAAGAGTAAARAPGGAAGTAPAGAAPAASSPPAGTTAALLDAGSWPQVVAQLELTGLARQLAANCAFVSRQGAQLRLLLDARGQSIRSAASEEKLAAALARFLGAPVRLQIDVADSQAPSTPARERDRQAEERLAQARAALEVDPTIQALRNQMGATIFAESVRPNQGEET
jgi:DNA polymerase-3 subunit gamma/tau